MIDCIFANFSTYGVRFLFYERNEKKQRINIIVDTRGNFQQSSRHVFICPFRSFLPFKSPSFWKNNTYSKYRKLNALVHGVRDAPIPILTNSNSWNWLELVRIGIGIGRNWLELELELVGIGWNWNWCIPTFIFSNFHENKWTQLYWLTKDKYLQSSFILIITWYWLRKIYF
jgi:hypothetical protein